MLENKLTSQRKIVLLPILIILIILGIVAYQKGGLQSETSEQTSQSIETTDNQNLPAEPEYQTIYSTDVADVAPAYDFVSQIPTDYQAEAVSAIEAINIFDPTANGDDNLEKSQIFIRYFQANEFQTLTTVDVLSTKELTLVDRPARAYEIEKKATVANFANQPSWRNNKHIVTDIKVNDANPATYYVIAANPDLDSHILEHFLDNLNLSKPVEPIAEFKARITKKKFGQLITPANSPVSPERFSGYHTGIDVEYADVVGDVPVRAIEDGTILSNRTADGYGGVLAIKHEIDGQTYVTIYGHLDPKSTPKTTAVKRGQKLGILGDDKSTETDGERKHLHFALHKGSSLDLAGYAQTSAELSSWLDPLSIFP